MTRRASFWADGDVKAQRGCDWPRSHSTQAQLGPRLRAYRQELQAFHEDPCPSLVSLDRSPWRALP